VSAADSSCWSAWSAATTRRRPTACSSASSPTGCSPTPAAAWLLLVPQFTLAADTSQGLRPGFSRAAEPGQAERLFGYMAKRAEKRLPGAQTGRFGAHMRVSLVNDGPVTFWIRVSPHDAAE
jgi:hypothetical protein